MLIKTVDAHYDSKHQIQCFYLSCSLLNIARGTCNLMIVNDKSNFQNNAKSGLPKFGIPMDGAFGKLEAGNLERANVDITSEMVTMLKTQQAFSGVSRLLQTEVDVTKRLIDG